MDAIDLTAAEADQAERRSNVIALGAALLTVLLWASAFVGIRAAGRDFSAGSLALGRLLVGSLALGLLVAFRRDAWPPRSDWPRLLLCGVAWFGLYNVVLNEAERRVDAGTAAMLVNLGPILIAILAGWLLKEGFPRSLVVGCAIAFVGTAVIGRATSSQGVGAGLGAVLCVVAALAYAVGVVAQKPLLARTSALQVTWLACVTGAVVCLPFAGSLVHDASHASAGAIAWTIYLGVFPTAVGFTLWAFALARTTAGRLGSTTYLVPPVAIFLGWSLLGEAPPAVALLGGLLCLCGVIVARRGR